MADLASALKDWEKLGAPPSTEDAAQFSLLWRGDVAEADVKAAVSAIVGGVAFKATPAFPGEYGANGATSFWILTFPSLTAVGTETRAFEAARLLRAALPVESVRPILLDSLVGAALAGPRSAIQADSFSKFCSSDDPGPEPRGWAPLGLNVLEAWTKTKGAGVTVASIDTGYSDHDQLKGVVTNAKEHLNLIEGGDSNDRFSTNVLIANPGHGTLVASVVASRGSLDTVGGTGGPNEVTGAAPEAQVLPIRAIRSVVDIRQSRIPAAIEHAIAQDCDVIIMALGSAFVIEPVEEALRKAARAGIVTVCAAGNCYGPVVFPAKMAPLGLATAVAAVDYVLQPWEKTCKGPEVTVSAFGESVWGAKKNAANAPNTTISASQGTTLASSLTAGVAALWVAHHGGRAKLLQIAATRKTTVQKLFNEAVQKTAHRPSGWPSKMGAGLLDAAALLNFDITKGSAIPSDAPGAPTGVTPLKRFLTSTMSEADAIAGQESAILSEDLAAETLWRAYAASARARAVASGYQPPQVDAMSGARSQELSDALQATPRLRDLIH